MNDLNLKNENIPILDICELVVMRKIETKLSLERINRVETQCLKIINVPNNFNLA